MTRMALTRAVPESIVRCELTHLAREPIDVVAARREHARLEAALAELGVAVRRLPDAPGLPDSVFVEDTAVVLEDFAVLARPGAESRREEVDSVADVLKDLHPLARLTPPATLDGGDVLILDHEIVVGLSARTNQDGVLQLRDHVSPLGYRVRFVPVTRCLHLKSAVTRAGERALLVNREWVDVSAFAGWELVFTHPDETSGANALLVNGALIYPDGHPRTRERLERAGCSVYSVPAGELAKAEGGVTCCALLV